VIYKVAGFHGSKSFHKHRFRTFVRPWQVAKMVATKTSQFTDAALQQRLALAGKAGPQALVRNFRVFLIACFACIGGLLYGYNQGVFGGIL
jgi:hypothetical protein